MINMIEIDTLGCDIQDVINDINGSTGINAKDIVNVESLPNMIRAWYRSTKAQKESKLTNNVLVNRLIESGILIGSRRWGGCTEKSDWDIVYSTTKIEQIVSFLESHGYTVQFNSGSSGSGKNVMYNIDNIKVEIGDILVNIITYDDKDLEKIEKLNEYMDIIKDLDIGKECKKNKRSRTMVVENFLDITFGEVSSMHKIDINKSKISYNSTNFLNFNKAKEIPLYITGEGKEYKYEPLDDLTTIELSKIMMFLIGANIGTVYDAMYYFTENDLMRHFTEVK